MEEKVIRIQGAREHNLQNLDVTIPRDKLVVITGLSGSGKSSLAFDTIYAEGQRKYVESLSAYARQFLEQMQKPDMDHIEGLPPTIAIEQRSASHNPRSTVATTTEIYDYLRLLFARVGTPYCRECGKRITQQSPTQIVDEVMALEEGTRLMILAPLVRGKKGEHKDIFRTVQRDGFVRVRVNGEIHDIGSPPKLAKNRKHTIEAVVDRLVVKPSVQSRMADSIELALKQGEGLMVVSIMLKPGGDAWEDRLFSEKYGCPKCGISLEELSPRLFSFNSPYGACPDCSGLGTLMEFDVDLVVPDTDLPLSGGAVEAWRHNGKRMNIYYNRLIRRFCRHFSISAASPFKSLSAEAKRILLRGTTACDQKKHGYSFEGVMPNLRRRYDNTESEYVKTRLHSFLSEKPCPACKGARLKPEALAVKIGRKNIRQLVTQDIKSAVRWFARLKLTDEQAMIVKQVLKEIRDRLTFLAEVGLGYLTLDRKSGSLSGGEAQRIRLATQVGSRLVGVCYVLDEPTIGLHQRDNQRLLGTLRRLRDLPNTVIVVEHDEDAMRQANHIIDMGPLAGKHGGRIVAEGTFEDILASPRSLTGKYLSGELEIPTPPTRRSINMSTALTIKGARAHNLKKIDVTIPLGAFVCVTGVSGSGKSTLITETLLPAMRRYLYGSRVKPLAHDRINGTKFVDKVIEIDQSPIGRTPRSNPATYVSVFDQIRQLYAKTKEAKLRGYKPGRFSFNVKGGRCEACQGQGVKRIEMHFLPDVYVTCQSCKGTRYNRETLEIRYRGRNIADVLDMRVEEAMSFFENFPKIKRLVKTLHDVGLGYMALGQPSTTLSGGEAQRIKLSAELGKRATGHTLYVLDEPTTGLHFADIQNLLNVLNRLTDAGNTVLVIEHNLDVIKCADWIIDLGPDGGEKGGSVVTVGPPERIVEHPTSYTGKFLKKKLAKRRTF